MKPIQVSGYGNAIVDILVRAEEADISRLGLRKGDMQLVEAEVQKSLILAIEQTKPEQAKPVLVSGGALANSMIAFAQLGGKAAFNGCVADDAYGLHYTQEMTEIGIEFDVPLVSNQQTGTSLILITPDSERTMCTNLAVSATLDVQHVSVERAAQSEWLAVEGYLLSSAGGRSVAKKVKQLAKDNFTKLVATISAEFIATVFRDDLRNLIDGSAMVLANLEEARVFLGAENIDAHKACQLLSELSYEVVVTDGANGASGVCEGRYWHVPAVSSQPVDLTGAGDMFSGVYLYGRCLGHDPELCAQAGNFMAHKVIQQVGARLADNMPTNLFS